MADAPIVKRHLNPSTLLGQVAIYDTLNTYLASHDQYSPKTAGVYKWPIEKEVGFYSTLYVGRRASGPSEDETPPGVVYEGCFTRTSLRSFKGNAYELPRKGDNGMTAKVGTSGNSTEPGLSLYNVGKARVSLEHFRRCTICDHLTPLTLNSTCAGVLPLLR